MLGRAQIVNAAPKKVAAKTTFTLRHLRHQALWGSAAAAALLIAVLASRSDLGSQRAAMLLSALNFASSSPHSPQAGAQAANAAAPRQPDAEAAARQLAQTVRGLAEDRDRIMTRLTAVEHNLDDMTGSITRQIEAAKAATAESSQPPWPDTPPVPTAPASAESVAPPVVPPVTGLASPLPSAPMTPAAEQSTADASASVSPPAYGADIGSGSSIKALHMRWAGLRAAHPQIFEGLQPLATLKDNPRSKRTELRLVVGPFPSAQAAVQLCASLAPFRLFCQPTMFDGRHLALQ